jgi:cell division transport system ATP-binding protein
MDIRLAGVTKIFEPDIVALEDVYLSIDKGEFVYLVGTTGSGKTTLLRLISREYLPSRGQITVGDVNLRKISRGQLPFYRRDVGVVFQDYKLLPNLTVFENVAFVLEAMGIPPRIVKNRSNEVIDQVGLWRRRFLKPPQLSGGEQQRVAIARAMANSPSIFLADEPTGNLEFFQFVQKLIRIDNHSVADNAGLARIEHPRGKKVKHIFLSVDQNSMACIRTSLIPGEHIHFSSKCVHDTPFSFIAPLGANNSLNSTFHHIASSRSAPRAPEKITFTLFSGTFPRKAGNAPIFLPYSG